MKEKIINITFVISFNERKLLVSSVLKYSDEYETNEDFIELSKMSKKELRILLWNILKYYLNETDKL